MARARPAVADAFDRACFGRCEFPQLLQDNALRRAIADTGRSGGRDADRDGCPALARELSPLRRGGTHAGGRGGAFARGPCRSTRPGLPFVERPGTQTYLAALTEATAPALYGDACAALIRWQLASRQGMLPPYDETLLRRELDLFPDWYIARHVGVTLDKAQRETLSKVFQRILDNNLAQARVYVHRDYHSRNLMVSDPNPGVLDFQDAVYGPITYDLVSLLRDAYVEWGEALQIDWAARYWQRARAAELPVGADFGTFWRDFEWMGVQRQLKVLGIFARLYHRDGKDAYLKEMPRVMRYLRDACSRYDELSPLLRLLDEFQARQPAIGYSA